MPPLPALAALLLLALPSLVGPAPQGAGPPPAGAVRAAAGTGAAPVSASRPGWRSPAPTVVVLRRFAPGPHPWSPGHRGVDLALPAGAAVLAAGPGRVVFAGPVAGRGVVSVAHGALRTTYEPVLPLVRAGDLVAAGSPLGVLEAGHPGCGECLHWGLRRGEAYLDPLRLLRPARVRLLPLGPHA